jgi:hypothetical protein
MISTFFNVNYINEISFYNKFINQDEHIYANQLLNFSDNNWNEYSYMYNVENLKDYIRIGDSKGDIIIKFSLSNITQNNFNDVILNLQHIIHQYDEGTYKYNGFTIIINKKQNIIKDKIKTFNPLLNKEHKYLVY